VTAQAAPSRLPVALRMQILARMLLIQASWNYESMLGTGMGFCMEPALRRLPGGTGGDAYRDALARQSGYFNAHPYMAALAIGALARAELDREPTERIERFRGALCGPLGSIGDRLVWAGWLPFCSLVSLAAFGVGLGAYGVVILFLGLYNAGHIWLRVWGLNVGWERGLGVAAALGAPALRFAPPWIARAAALAGGIALPLSLDRVIGSGRVFLGGMLVAVTIGFVLILQLHGRVEGWRLAMIALAAFVLYSVAT
jgi:mannose PTS system EIID component